MFTHSVQQLLDSLAAKLIPAWRFPGNTPGSVIPKLIFTGWGLLGCIAALDVWPCQAQVCVPGRSEIASVGNFRFNLGTLVPESRQRLVVSLNQITVLGGDNGIPQRSNRGSENSLFFFFSGCGGMFPDHLVASALAPFGEVMIDESNHKAPRNASGDGLKEGVHDVLCVLTGGFLVTVFHFGMDSGCAA